MVRAVSLCAGGSLLILLLVSMWQPGSGNSEAPSTVSPPPTAEAIARSRSYPASSVGFAEPDNNSVASGSGSAVSTSVRSVVTRPDDDNAFWPMAGMEPKPPILDIPVQPREQADRSLQDDDLVLGVIVGQVARAYPVTQLCGPNREIINDELGGSAIAATW
jgi:hypothetical protein